MTRATDTFPPPRKGRSGGFSLLEVMVAIAILGLALTAILAAQAGVFSASQRARSLSVATGLARCKMTEIEDKLQKDGFPELDEDDSGPCCDDDDNEKMRCTWRIEKPELPEAKLGELDLDTDLNLGGLNLGSFAPSVPGGAPGGAPIAPGGGTGDLAASLAGLVTESGGTDALAGMALSMVYPDLKTLFESSSRRVTVTVHWADGELDRTLDVMQWVTKAATAPAASGTSSGGSPTLVPPGGGTSPPINPFGGGSR